MTGIWNPFDLSDSGYIYQSLESFALESIPNDSEPYPSTYSNPIKVTIQSII